MDESTVTLDVIFDGQCGVCTRAAAWLARRDRHGRVALHPAQRPGVCERFGVSAEAARTAVWAIERKVTGGGAAYRGAAAVNRAVEVALGVRGLSGLYVVPGITALQNRVYRWVADHRHRLPGATPWCTAHPADCGGAADAGAGTVAGVVADTAGRRL